MINPLFLILQSISGGVAGYITNKYAVNMLFKEYTPIKLGGVVKKNKEKFIDEIIQENEKVCQDYKSGKESALQFLVGRVMSKTKGKANPGVVLDMLKNKLS